MIDDPVSRAERLPAELAAEIAVLPANQTHTARVAAVNRGLRSNYQARLDALCSAGKLSDRQRQRIANDIARQCDQAIIDLTEVDAKGWAGGSPTTT